MRGRTLAGRLIGTIAAMALLGPTAVAVGGGAAAVVAGEPRDVALDGTAVASSVFPDPERFAPEHANDGDPSTRWGSDYTHGDEEPSYPPSDHDPTNDWIQIELTEPSPVHKVVFDWEGAYARQYEVQVSDDGAAWETVASLAGHVGRQEVVLDITDPVSFVRMQGREASPWGYSMWAFEVWDAAETVEEPDPTGWDHGTDVAPAGTATAASVYTGDPERFAARNAIDENSGTRWGTDYARNNPAEPPPSDHDPSDDWIQVELAEPSPVWSVVLDWETARPASFEIQVSDDGETWTTVREVTNPPVGITEYVLGLEEPVSFVRMQGRATATPFGYSLWSFEVWSGPQAPPAPGGEIVPIPVSVTEVDEEPFVLGAATRVVIAAEDAAVRAEAELLAERLRPATGFDVPVVTGEPGAGDIALVLGAGEAPEGGELATAEGYTLSASADGVRIGAAQAHGLFNGAQTLLQLLPAQVEGDVVRPGPWVVEAVEIVDHPRFSHRGVMLDPARNFIEVDGVLGIIDAMAAMKGNRLHMHLSDDQGWRIEIESWPRLTEVGGSMSMPGGRSGFYTQEELAQIVAYADARHIEVIPEIDWPGHSSAAIASYPELACGSTNTVCTTSAVVDDFMNDVIAEISALTNSDLFHIGGDESISGQPYIDFIKKVEGFVMDHGLRMVGWTPLPMAGLHPSSIHHYWRDQSREMTPEWFEVGNDVILSPTSKAYLDYPYPGHNALSTHDWDPTNVIDDYRNLSLQSFGLDNEDIIGIEGPAWGENNSGGAVDVEHKVFPRLASILDLAWSPQELTTDSRSFLERLAVQGARWQFAGTNFWPDPGVAWETTLAGTVHEIDGDDLTVDGPLATIATPTTRVENLSATIDWGDGTTTEAVLTGTSAAGKVGNSLYQVTGEHTYAEPGDLVGTVTVTGPGEQSWTTTFQVVAAAEPLPVYDVQTSHTNALFSLRAPGYGGAVPFVTDGSDLETFGAWIVSGSSTGTVTLSVRTDLDDPTTEVATDTVDIGALGGTGQGWMEFELDGADLTAGERYFAVIQAHDWEAGTNVAWWGNRAPVEGALRSWAYDADYWGGWQEYGVGAAERFANYNLAFYVNDALAPDGCASTNTCWRHVPAEDLAVNPAGLLGTPGNPYALSSFQVVGAQYVPGSSVLELPDGNWFYLPADADEPVVVPADHPDAVAQIEASRAWLESGTVPGRTEDEREMAERALLDMRLLLQDNGATAAAWHGIWRYSWPRDSSFTSAAFARTGHLEEAYRILQFNASTLRLDCDDRPDNCEVGTWDARTVLDGSGPPDDRAWQLDANGWVPWATWQYLQVASPDQQETALEELYPTIRVAADYAAESLDENGIPPARPDYWESAYPAPNLGTAAPLLAGLRSAAAIAQMADETEDAERWIAAADLLQDGIEATFGENGYQRTVVDGSGKDSAITFLAPPFNPADEEMWAEIDEAWDVLVEPTGGVKPGESWTGAETWTPETMFFALAWANGGQTDKADALIEWMDEHRTTIGAFPEKVTPEGDPAAVATLGWTASLTALTLASVTDPMPVPPADLTPTEEPTLTVAAETRCVVGRVVETVRVASTADEQTEVVISGTYGTRTVTVAPEGATSVAFSSRLRSVPAGEVNASTGTGAAATSVTASYAARACG